MKKIITIIIFILLSGCSKHYLNTSSTYTDHTKAEKVNKDELKPGHILFIADNQKAFLNTESILEQSQISEDLANTAHRRAALDEFSLNVVEYIQESQPQADLLIHAGDMLNNSCVSEFKLAANQFEQGSNKKPWFIAPGNHDGYYLGISSPTRIKEKILFLNERSNWVKICTDAKKMNAAVSLNTDDGYSEFHDEIMDKFVFVQHYVTELGLVAACRDSTVSCKSKELKGEYQGYTLRCLSKDDMTSDQATDYLGSRAKYFVETCWTDKGDLGELKNKFYPKASAANKYYDVSPWYNYVIQRIRVPNDHGGQPVIIMDTSSYLDDIAMNSRGELKIDDFGAADHAYLSNQQAEKLLEWAKEDKGALLIGHHPIEDLKEGSKARLAEIADVNKSLMYISGDTHDGFDVMHHLNYELPIIGTKKQSIEGGATEKIRVNLREANLGSTIDAPLEYAKGGWVGGDIKPRETANKFVLQRFSLTPTGVNHNFERPYILSNFKRKVVTEVDGDNEADFFIDQETKLYLTADKKWGECVGKYFPEGFDINLGPEDPLGLRGDKDLVEIMQTKGFLWFPHVVGFLADWPDNSETKHSKIIHQRNITVYKLNRMIRLVEVYKSIYGKELFNQTVNDSKKTVKQKMDSAYDALRKLENNTFAAFVDFEESDGDEKSLFHVSLKAFSELIQDIRLLEIPIDEIETIEHKKLCSALFEAERERRPRSGVSDMDY